jgi:lysophospholipase L1-like esterase
MAAGDFEVKDWRNNDPSTAWSAEAAEDLELRLSTYTDDQVTEALASGGGGAAATAGTLASRPTATGSGDLYIATDDAGGTTYLDTAAGVWTATGSGVIPTGPGPSYNVSPVYFKKWRAGLSRVRAGTAFAKILCIGDSTTEGQQATTFAQNYPSILASLLNSYYVPTVQGFAFSNAGGSGPFDTRITLGTNWTREVMGDPSIAFGYFSNSTSASTGTLAYAPTHTVDSFDIYYLGNSAAFTWNVDGGADATITPAGSQSVSKTTVSAGAAGVHTLNIKHINGNGATYIVGIDGYNSASKAVKVGNAAIGGTKTADWITTGYPNLSTFTAITAVAPDLTIICLGINDAGSSVSASTYQSNLQALITAAQTVGDVLLCSMPPSDTAPYTTFEPTYLPVLQALAASNNCGYLDLYSRWVSYTSANALGYFADGLHPSTLGYSDWAQSVMNVLKDI